ncbi:MAG TPA: 2-oxoglutarate dehydrogenase E1 component [Chlamydiales bacterium]|nr:2-oxoglutarate dehydrogenase E1 component [Chlamydiales bacterium]
MDEPIHIANLQAIEKLYREYRRDPKKADPSLLPFFAGMEFASYEKEKGEEEGSLRIFRLILAYRQYGHLMAHVNPLKDTSSTPVELALKTLGFSESDLNKEFSTLGFLPAPSACLKEIIQKLSSIYAGRIGIEYMELDNLELEEWIQKKVEPELDFALTLEEKKIILDYLNRAEIFESFLHTKFVGQKRFSLEGGETLIPLLWAMLEEGNKLNAEEFVFGMAHRGRLNVLTNILKKSYSVVFHEFESGNIPIVGEGTSDVKYHKGFVSTVNVDGKELFLQLAPNPSHLEAVDPVVLGQVRARQGVKQDGSREKVVPILIHGDASFAGQGIIYECMQLMNLEGYTTGGTIHIIINNQIGFTTLPEDARSTRYATDIAKSFGCPVFHVNAEDPESCYWAAKMAMQIRQKFKKDVFIDLICFRKYGHNEGDEPAFTQPLEYQKIRSKKPIRELYAMELKEKDSLEGSIAESLEKEFLATLHEAMEKAKTYIQTPSSAEIHGEEFSQELEADLFHPVKTSVSNNNLHKIMDAISLPAGFHLHPKLIKWMEERKEKLQKDPKEKIIDWSYAEFLAFGSLLLDQVPIRLSGQDCRRGTFSQRHAVWIDQENASPYFPLDHLKTDAAHFEVYNSPLSEFSVLGYEYGYSVSDPKALVLWEAQYGDFNNAAQVIIDQFISSAEQKWRRHSSLTLLLPHGMEGQGPEHSSGRLERYLQLSAQNNIQVVYPSTPAQYFHVLRRQGLRKIKKPLILFTPKSLLRLPACTSSIKELETGQFEEFLDDPVPSPKTNRLLICSGKIFYDLLEAREKEKSLGVSILRVEQFYPFNEEKFIKILAKYKGFQECCWVQEEPENMGSWTFMRPYLTKLLKTPVRYIGRPVSASPAAGSQIRHKAEQDEILKLALR